VHIYTYIYIYICIHTYVPRKRKRKGKGVRLGERQGGQAGGEGKILWGMGRM